MPVFEHVFKCQNCGGRVTYKNHNPDCDNPPLPSLFHNELAKHAQEKKDSTCSGRMFWESSVQKQKVVLVPVQRTVFDHSLEFTQGPQREGVNTICAALDIATGAYKKGVNGHGITRLELHLTLRGILAKVERLEAWNTGNCAEIEAVNKLLEENAQAQNIRVHSRDQYGRSKPPCENCQGWLEMAADKSFKIRSL